MKNIFFIANLFFSLSLLSQELSYLTHITTRNGLSNSEITSIFQDSKGFMWFGTDDGLNKFDGYDITIYKYNPQVSNTIGGNSIRCLFEDSQRNLWIGLKGDGLSRLNLQTGEFKTYKNKKGSNSLSYNDVSGIVEDEAGMIWISVDRGGLDMLNPQTEEFTHYDMQDKSTSLPLNNALTGIVALNDILILSSWGGGIYCFDKKEKRFHLHPYWNSGKTDKELCNHIFKIYKDGEENIWVWSAHNGLYMLNERNKEYKQYDICKIGGDCQNTINIRSVSDDGKNNLWIVTDKGIKILNKKTNTITDFENPIIRNESLYYIYKDNSDLIWLSSSSGIYYFSPVAPQFKELEINNFLSEKQVMSVLKDSKNNIWVGGLNNLEIISPEKKSIGKIYSKNSSLYQAICEDIEGNIWIGNYSNNLIKYNPHNDSFSQITIPSPTGTTYTYRNVYDIKIDWNNSLWLATELGAINYNPDTKVFTSLFESKNIIYPEDKTRVIHRDQEMLLWVGTERGLKLYTRDLVLKKIYTTSENQSKSLSNDFITAILEDKDGILWIGTKGGLHRFDKKTQEFELIRRNNTQYADPIFGLAQDNQGNLWMTTPSQLLKYNIKEQKFWIFNEYDGLQDQGFLLNAFTQAKDGELLIGGKNGLNRFYPNKLTMNQTKPKVVISDFQIFNHSIKPEKNGILTKLIDQTSEIKIKHSQSVISFKFSALNYKASSKNQYAYMLEGFDNNWIYTSQRIATYTNLDSGEYVFKVRASNNDGIWNEAPTTIKLIITPPFWKSKFAYLLYLLMALGIVVLIVRYYTEKERDKQNIRISQLEALRMYEINEMKTKFFSNISHEFKTPLSLIIGPLNQIIEEDSISVEYKNRYNMKMMLRNAQKLMRLINQLLDFRKLEKNKLELDLQYDDVVKFIKNVSETFSYLALEKQIQYNIRSTIPALWMPFDSDKLDKILYNLIGNAFQYTPEKGSISVLISVTTQNENKYLQIKISDTGIGISAEEKKLLFTIFSQGERQKLMRNEGSGLGLAFTKDLIDLHKGYIEVESEINQGATFSVLLPIENVPQLHDENSITLQQIDSSSTKTNTTEKEIIKDANEEIILVIEDNDDMRDYIKSILSDEFKVILARDGEEGIDRAINYIPDLIVSDIMMPKRDGISMVKELKNNEKTNHIPIILLTSLDKESQIVEGYNLGVEDYITKPFSAKILTKRIQNILASREKLWQLYNTTSDINVYKKKLAGNPWKEEFIEKISEIIMTHISEAEFSIEVLASDLNMSVNQLFRKVKAIMNTTPYNVILQIRMTQAALLLQDSDLNISEIAFRVGYQELSNFSRAFKKFHGKSPRDYIKNKSKI